MNKEELDKLRIRLSVESKNGIDFIIAATIIWSLIAFIWSLDFDPYHKSILVFIIGSPMIPIAFLISKFIKTFWRVKDNPLQPLGLWLNIAQLFYFPFLIFVLIKSPDYFIMTYSIITGAHLFPYSWFYKTKFYALFAGIISIGNLLIGLSIDIDKFFYIGVFTSICLMFLSIGLIYDLKSSRRKTK